MTIEEMLEELTIISNVRRHFTSKAVDLENMIDLDRIIQKEAEALQEKLPGGLVVWDESTQVYGVYPADR